MLFDLRDLFGELLEPHVKKVVFLLKLKLRMRNTFLEDLVDGSVGDVVPSTA